MNRRRFLNSFVLGAAGLFVPTKAFFFLEANPLAAPDFGEGLTPMIARIAELEELLAVALSCEIMKAGEWISAIDNYAYGVSEITEIGGFAVCKRANSHTARLVA